MLLRSPAILLVVGLLLPSVALARQSDGEAEAQVREAQRQRRLEQDRQVQESLRLFDRLANQRTGPPPSGFGRSSKGAPERAKFYATVPLFREATSRYREALGLEPDLKAPAKEIEKLINPLRDYFDTLKFKRAAVDLSLYEGLTGKDLAWETLTMAERVDNNLQVARKFVQQSERDGVIHIRILEFLGEIQDDLSRLKWLASRVSDAAPPGKKLPGF